MDSLKMILVTPSAAPGEYYYLAYEELIPRQLYGDEKEDTPGAYFRVYDRDFEFEVIKKYAEIVTRSKVPIQEENEEFFIETFNDTWCVAKILRR
jgi:hypothetical protein